MSTWRTIARSVVWRVGRAARRVAHHLAVGERDRQELAARLPVAQRMNVRLDLHPRRERLRQPALPRQASGAVHLDRPRDRLTLLIIDVQQDPGVGVRPLEFFHGTLELDDLEGIKHGEGMVRRSRNSISSKCGSARKAECSENHGRLQGVLRYSLFSGILCSSGYFYVSPVFSGYQSRTEANHLPGSHS